MPIDESGFLATEIQHWIKRIRQDHSALFMLADEVNRLCQKSMFELDAHNRNVQEMLVATLYIRVLSNYQGAILLCERGMTPEARTVLRAMLEALFSLCAIAKEQKLAVDFVKEDQRRRLKFLVKYRKVYDGLPEHVDPHEIETLEEELKKEKNEIRERSTEEWAKEAGLHDWYLTAYAVLSDSVHSKVRDLERYLFLNEKEEVVRFRWGPDDNWIQEILVTNIEGILVGLKCTISFFGQQKDKIIEDLRARLREIAVLRDAKGIPYLTTRGEGDVK